MPDVSVLVPCWNAAQAIERAIASVLEATSLDLEVVVVDDASTDGTADIVDRLAASDPRIVLVRQPVNGGVSAARNAGLEHVRGTWLTLLDADDRFLTGGLAALHRAAIATDALAVVGQQVWSNGRRHWIGPLYDQPDIRTPRRTSIAASPGLLYHASPHAKLFHRSVVDGLRFEGRVLGDQPWVVRGLLRAGERLEVIGDEVYEWIRTSPPGAGPSITAATRASTARGVEAAGVAARAHAEVSAEAIATLGPGAAADRVSTAYAERLLRSDLAAHVDRALSRRDPTIGALFGAIQAFLAGLPPGTLATSDVLARDVVLPPLRRWPALAPPARPAFWALVATALAIQPDLARHAGAPVAARALDRALRSSGPARTAAIAVLMALGLAGLPRLAPRAAAALRRRL
ncbi:MAG TPA: glycosyltransferase family 2 protein [Candidatus Limnocylindrales bacterium]